MRIYKNAGPYHGRQPEAPTHASGGAVLRQPSKPEPKIKYWSEPRAAHAPQAGRGDTKDSHLTGWGDPYSDAHYGKKK